MNEIVALVVQKTGLSEDHAKAAVETVLTFIKGKLPGPIASQIDGLIASGGAGNLGNLGALTGDLGGLFGKK